MGQGTALLVGGWSALLSSSAVAGSLIGISVGDPLANVPAKLRGFGEVKEVTGLSGGGYITTDYVVVGCKGRVWGVTRTLSPTFRTFTAAAKKAELELATQPMAEIISDDGTAELSGVALRWDLGDGSLRTVDYLAGRSGISVSEGVRRKTYC